MAGAWSREERFVMQWRVEVIVMPKDGVSDPQGEAVKGGLQSLGHSGVSRVRVGRHIEVTVDAADQAAAHEQAVQMTEQLLANLVIEQYLIGAVSAIEPAGVS